MYHYKWLLDWCKPSELSLVAILALQCLKPCENKPTDVRERILCYLLKYISDKELNETAEEYFARLGIKIICFLPVCALVIELCRKIKDY